MAGKRSPTRPDVQGRRPGLPSNTDAALAAKPPSDGLPTYNRRNLLSHTLLDHRPPWHEAKVHAVVEHGEAAARELDASAIDPTGQFAVLHRVVSLPVLVLKGFAGCYQLPVMKCRQ